MAVEIGVDMNKEALGGADRLAEVAAFVDKCQKDYMDALEDKVIISHVHTAHCDIRHAIAKFIANVRSELGDKATVEDLQGCLGGMLETAGLARIVSAGDMKEAAIAGAKVWTAEYDAPKKGDENPIRSVTQYGWCVQHPPGTTLFRGKDRLNWEIASLMLDLLNEKEKPKEPEQKTFYVVARMSHDSYAVGYYRNIADYVSFEPFTTGGVDEYVNCAGRDLVSVTQDATLFAYKCVAIRIAECLQNQADKLPGGDTVLYAVAPVNK